MPTKTTRIIAAKAKPIVKKAAAAKASTTKAVAKAKATAKTAAKKVVPKTKVAAKKATKKAEGIYETVKENVASGMKTVGKFVKQVTPDVLLPNSAKSKRK